MIGETISHYRVLRRLGAGNMDEVYEAEDLLVDLQTREISILPGSKGMFGSRWSPNGKYIWESAAKTRS
jgi:hypothetical protein